MASEIREGEPSAFRRLELSTDFSHPSQGVLSSDGLWRVKSISNGKGESGPSAAGWEMGRAGTWRR